jgi:hypothetical protein
MKSGIQSDLVHRWWLAERERERERGEKKHPFSLCHPKAIHSPFCCIVKSHFKSVDVKQIFIIVSNFMLRLALRVIYWNLLKFNNFSKFYANLSSQTLNRWSIKCTCLCRTYLHTVDGRRFDSRVSHISFYDYWNGPTSDLHYVDSQIDENCKTTVDQVCRSSVTIKCVDQVWRSSVTIKCVDHIEPNTYIHIICISITIDRTQYCR